MILQTTGAAVGEAALLTFKGLFSGMFELVCLEISNLSARIVTLLTHERLLS